MKRFSYTAFAIGLMIVIGLVAWQGRETIWAAFAELGAGVLILPLVYLPHLFGAALSWRQLLPKAGTPSVLATFRAIWIGTSIEALVPGGGIGGEAVKVRLAMRAGVPGTEAAASVVVDIAVQTMVLCLWTGAGIILLLMTKAGVELVWPAFAGAIVLVAGLGLFAVAQHIGFFGLFANIGARISGTERWHGIVKSAGELDRAIRSLYARPSALLTATAIRTVTRTFLAVEFWLAAYFMQSPIDFGDVIVLVGIVSGLRAAVVIFPGGWGVQEGGYVLLGGLIGLPAHIVLAVSLATRARELMIGIPALIAWQMMEGRSFKAG